MIYTCKLDILTRLA